MRIIAAVTVTTHAVRMIHTGVVRRYCLAAARPFSRG